MKSKIEEIKKKIIPILKKNKVVKAGIFGSYARGEETKDSDIDILVEIKNPKLSLLGFIKLERELREVLKKKVDLVEYQTIKIQIKDRILNETIEII